ncbi:MAG TPA: DUF87 domain-containing protein, partial [Pirellulales bacterium]
MDFAPPYPTWPFHPEAFQTLGHDTPREVLQKCHALRQGWLRSGEIVEVSRFGEPAPPTDRPDTRFKSLDDAFALYKREAKPAALLDPEEEEAGLASLLQTALTSLVHELAPPPGGEAVVDVEFTGGVKRKPLHARLRIVAADQSERHFCVRAIQQMHPLAFQPRLREAVTAAGISSSLSFRHLAIVRSTPKLTGRATLNQVAEFEQAGGRFAVPTEEEIRTLSAIKKMRAEQLDGLTEWLRDRRPLSQLPLLRTIVDTVLDEFAPTKKPAAVAPIEKGPDKPTTGRGDSPSKPGPTGVSTGGGRTSDGTDDPSHNGVNGKGPVDPSGTKPSGAGVKTSPLDAPPLDPAESSGRFPLGWNLRGEKLIDPLEMDLTLLAKHTAILAGAGSGKTVLLKRLIESAALRGVPSIVFDCAQDLVQLKQDWTTPHAAWLPGDAAAARRLREQTEVVVWTPNLSKGNPLSLETLPDLAAVADDEDELQSGIVMASESLQEIVAQGQSVASQNKQGILRKTLKYFAQTGGGTLADYMDLLRSLPSDARLNVQNEQKLAKQMADALTVAIEKDPLLQATGPVLDPASLFGLESQSGKVRISVVSLIGLPTKGAQQTFLNQLAMRLFTWIKKNPAPKGKLRGLFVIDEAKDFAPSIRSTPCKASLQRLAAQARKYGLGVVIATQMPREVDASLIGNCSTHYYGKANSSAALEAIKDQIRERGGSGDDV